MLVDSGKSSSWVGGNLSVIRTVFDKMCGRAITLGLLTVLLTLLNLSSNLQPAVQGLIVIAVLAGRLVVERVAR